MVFLLDEAGVKHRSQLGPRGSTGLAAGVTAMAATLTDRASGSDRDKSSAKSTPAQWQRRTRRV